MFNDLYFRTRVEDNKKLHSLTKDEKDSVKLLLKETFRDYRHACHEIRVPFIPNEKADLAIEAAFRNGFREGQDAHANA